METKMEIENQQPSYAELTERKKTFESNLEAGVMNGDYQIILLANAQLRELEPMLKAAELTDVRKTLVDIEEERLELSRQAEVLESELSQRQKEFVKASDIANQRRIDFQETMLQLGIIDSRQTDLLEARREKTFKLRENEKALLSRAINN